MAVFHGTILSKSEYRSDEPIRVTFTLTNDSREVLYVLKWLTPLEGLWSDCLNVFRDGVAVRYDGSLAKRGLPGRDDFRTFEPGESVSTQLELDEAYEVSVPGIYSILANTEVHAVTVRDLESLATSRKNALEALGAFEGLSIRQPLPEAVTSFRVTGTEPGRPTRGERVRRAEAARLKSSTILQGVLGTAKDPVFVGGDKTKQDQTKQAHFDGYKLSQDALRNLANDKDYAEWFGVYSDARFQAVKGHFSAIVGDMEQKTYTYDLSGQGCPSGVYAYTHKDSTTIWTCDLFWSAPSTGTDSKAGTIVHEHSHASASTDDLAYGQAKCRQLAINDPDKAIRNADSHEYYSKG